MNLSTWWIFFFFEDESNGEVIVFFLDDKYSLIMVKFANQIFYNS